MTNGSNLPSEQPVLLDMHGDVAVVRLNRPQRMNAVNHSLRTALIETLSTVNRDTAVRAIVLAGNGPRAFCAGQDLHESAGIEPGVLVSFIEATHAMYRAVRSLDKPCVAAIHGVAAGAGFQIAMCSDLRIATPNARIGQPEVKAGLASIVGSYFMTLHLGMGHNVELSLSGELVSGRRAYEIGLVNQLVETDDANAVLVAALDRAALLAALPATAVRVTKQRMRALTQPDFDEACVAGIRYQLECYTTGEPQAAIAAFFSARGKVS